MNKNEKKATQLGMPIGTAANRLRKMIIFNFLKKLNENYCFQCGGEICNIDELSIEHKIPYLDSENPVELYFDLNNIGFSHLDCNCSASRKTVIAKHPSVYTYRKGCRCKDCTKLATDNRNRQRINQKNKNNNVGVV